MKTIIRFSIVVLMVFSTTLVFSQALITDEETPDPVDANAMFEIRSDNPANPGGLLIPRVSLSLDGGEVILGGMESPTEGLLIYNVSPTDIPEKGLWYYDLTEGWVLYSRAGSVYSLSTDNYGEMFEVANEVTPVVYDLDVAEQWYPWESSEEGEVGAFFDYIPGAPLPDGGNGDVLSVTGAGVYQVTISATIKSLTSGNTFTGKLFVDGAGIDKIQFSFHYQTSNDVASLGTSGLINLIEGEVVSFRFKSEDGNDEITIESLNLTLAKISEPEPPSPLD